MYPCYVFVHGNGFINVLLTTEFLSEECNSIITGSFTDVLVLLPTRLFEGLRFLDSGAAFGSPRSFESYDSIIFVVLRLE